MSHDADDDGGLKRNSEFRIWNSEFVDDRPTINQVANDCRQRPTTMSVSMVACREQAPG
jgi:hypothetical protein